MSSKRTPTPSNVYNLSSNTTFSSVGLFPFICFAAAAALLFHHTSGRAVQNTAAVNRTNRKLSHTYADTKPGLTYWGLLFLVGGATLKFLKNPLQLVDMLTRPAKQPVARQPVGVGQPCLLLCIIS